MFKQITILAPGLLGASLGAGAFERKITKSVVVWARREETLRQCRQMAWCDRVEATVEAAVAGADLVVVCAPVSVIADLVDQCLPVMDGDALITDVGSTKAAICQAVRQRHPDDHRFVGSHPMAGSEKSGLEYADGGLFEGCCCMVTGEGGQVTDSMRRIALLWEGVGMRVRWVDPGEHDHIVAQISHLPHILATLLAAHLGGKEKAWMELAGSGLKDTTRIASGHPGMWLDILKQNRPAVLTAAQEFMHNLNGFIERMEMADDVALKAILEEGKDFRDLLNKDSPC